MPPKSKSQKPLWIQCEECCYLISYRDIDKHKKVCHGFKTHIIDDKVLQHGFVVSEILYGAVTTVEDKSLELPDKLKQRVLFLHPSLLQLCEFSVGAEVVLNHKHILYVWPDTKLNPTSIGLTPGERKSMNLESKDTYAIVEKLKHPVIGAGKVLIKADETKDFMKEKEFCTYFKQVNAGCLLTKNSKVSFVYFGQPCSLSVTEINGEFKLKTGPTSSKSITQKLQTLSLVEDAVEDKSPCLLGSYHSCCKSEWSLQFFEITHRTSVEVITDEEVLKKTETKRKRSNLTSIGGLEKQTAAIKELMQLQLQNSQCYDMKGLPVPKGVLLYGPTGTGKTSLVHSIASESEAHFVEIKGAEVWSKYYGESEAKLRSLFKEAKDRAPSIIFIDEVDALCPRRDTSHNEIEKRVVASLLTLLDSLLGSSVQVFVLAATSHRDNIDQALRRPGRLDREIEIGVPSVKDRISILEKILSKTSNSLSQEDIVSAAESAHGFVGADLAAVCKEAGLFALKRSRTVTDSLVISTEDLHQGLLSVKPSAMREVALEVPKVKWTDIGGQHDLKHKLKQAIEWPLKHPEAFARLGIRPPRGLLMYGPPGCSKTMIAKALARESGLNFIAIKGPELFSKWVGESERAVREVFRKARSAAPAIIFFDEIDALAGERGSHGGGGGDVADRVLAQLLTEIDGVDALNDVTIVAATNRPDRIDKALLRPGRLDRIVYVSLPDKATRREIFEIQFKKTPVAEDLNIDELVDKTDHFSGAEVSALCHEAALCAMQEDLTIEKVHLRHFEEALQMVTPRISQEMITFYNKYAKNSGLHSI